MNYRPHHTAISVRNLEKSLIFYTTLGYEEVHRYAPEDGLMVIVHLRLANSFIEIFWYKKNENLPKLEYAYANAPDEIGVKHIALWTDDIEDALLDMRNKGLADGDTQIKIGRTNVRYFFIQDPDGLWVELIQDDRFSK